MSSVNVRQLQTSASGFEAEFQRVLHWSAEEDHAIEERVKDLAIAVYRECAPFRGLPPELYKTDEGGWSNINLTYKLP